MRQTSEKPWFPPVHTADFDGLLMVGGRLTVDWMLAAYSRGIFPWPVIDGKREVLAWFSPDPRAILELDALHISRRLGRRLRGGRQRVTFNRAFDAVVRACAEPRGDDPGTWITAPLRAVYSEMHALGLAHSAEVWDQDQLVGGVYGIAIGGFFSGESMFYRRPDASKIALVHLVRRLQDQGFVLFDVQQSTAHMKTLGASEIGRAQFLRRLRAAVELPVSFAGSPHEPQTSAPFSER